MGIEDDGSGSSSSQPRVEPETIASHVEAKGDGREVEGSSDPETRDVIAAIELIVRSLRVRLQEDIELRSAVRRLGQWCIAMAEDADLANAEATASAQAEEDAKPSEAVPTALKELSIGDAKISVPVLDDGSESPDAAAAEEPPPAEVSAWQAPPPPDSVDLQLVADRARLKAECCRWAIDRRKRMDYSKRIDVAGAHTAWTIYNGFRGEEREQQSLADIMEMSAKGMSSRQIRSKATAEARRRRMAEARQVAAKTKSLDWRSRCSSDLPDFFW